MVPVSCSLLAVSPIPGGGPPQPPLESRGRAAEPGV